MAKQLNLLNPGKVVATALHTEMEQSYLEYAMSVIVGRALPDVRDGLKPVHRRILYAMHELGLTPDRPYRKCARVVGDVLGKYHPHGDQAVYDALVRMVQSFSSRYPLLDGHGNFGSVDNDPPAAMRYTETRLSPLSNQILLDEVGEATVDFAPNFDNSQQEPIVLPAQLPVLLLNGCSGIAVGMATNIPPHNLGELVDALIALIDRPLITPEKLQELVPGPDFPTGGEIIGTDGITDAYTTGRGSITLRAVVAVEEFQPSRGRHRRQALVVTELPYQVNKAGLLEKIAALINQGKIEGIADLRDESDRDGMRMVIELKREAQPEAILEKLYRLTPLQSNFGVIMLALVEGQPRQLPLKDLLQEFLNFRENTLTHQFRYQRSQAQQRLHHVEGLLTALDHLDAVIEILRHAPDGTTAKGQLQDQLDLSDRQADAILAMPLRRLTGLEQQNLRQENERLTQQIQALETLLGDRRVLLKHLKKDLRTLKRHHGNERRTRIETAPEPLVVAPPLQDEPVRLAITQRGYARWQRVSNRGRRKSTPPKTEQFGDAPSDWPIYERQTTLDTDLYVFTSSGKVYPVKVQDLPGASRRDRGAPLVTALPDAAHRETVVAQLLSTDLTDNTHLVMLSQQGRIKRLPLTEIAEITGRGATATKIKEGDQLGWVLPVGPETDGAIATSSGRLLRVPLQDISEMGRVAQGSRALRLRKQEHIVGIAVVTDATDVVLVTGKGYGKRIPIDLLRLGHVGDLGTQAMQFTTKTDALVGVLPALSDTTLVLESNQNRIAYLNPDRIPLWGKDGPGEVIINGKRGELIVGAMILPLDS